MTGIRCALVAAILASSLPGALPARGAGEEAVLEAEAPEPSAQAGGGAEAAIFEEPPPAVFGASRRRQSLEEAPSAVTIVTAEEIRRHGWRTITEVLSNVRGLYVSEDRNYSYLGVRGFARPGDYNSRVLVLVNGHAMNDAPYMSSLLGREFGIDMELVERIEVIRGPGSSLYGTNALFGVINVVTRSGPDPRRAEGLGFGAFGEADSLERAKAGVVLDRIFGEEVHVLVSGSAYYGRGQRFDYPEFEGVGFKKKTEREADRERAYNSLLTISWGPIAFQTGLN